MVVKEGDLFDPNLFPAEHGLAVGGVLVDFDSGHEALGEGGFLCFYLRGDEDSLSAHI